MTKAKKLLFLLLSSVFILGACGNEGEAVDAEVKKAEMTKDEALEHLEQITFRLVEAWEEEDGSFEQRSSLQAAIGRSESVIEEIEEEYEDIPIIEELKEVATHVKLGAEEGLEDKPVYIEIHLELIIEKIESMSILDGEMPQTLRDKFIV